MALPPPPMPPAGATPPPPPDAGAPAPDDTSAPQTVLSVTMAPDGTFTLYAGDEPDNDAEPDDMSGDDAAAMGDAGGGPAPQQASSLGEALKMAADILKAAVNGIGGGSAEQNFASGFTGAPVGGPPGGAAGMPGQ